MPNEPTAPSSDFLRPELKGLKGLIAGIKDQAGSPTALVPTPEPSHTPPAKATLPRPKQGSPRERPRTASTALAFARTASASKNLSGSPFATPPTSEVKP